MQFSRFLTAFGEASSLGKFTLSIAFILLHAQFSHCWYNQPQRISTPEECLRECRDGDTPRTCYYKFHIEYYTTQGAACDLLGEKHTNRSVVSPGGDECILSDGVEKTVFSINRMIPGPSIQVCLYDTLMIDVENKAEGLEVSLHWHGIFQKGSQYYDGVPFVTQCPIHSENTFRYTFGANNAGTHFYHSHIATHMLDGQYGALVVRAPPSENPHIGLYDADLAEHVILLSDLMHELSLEHFPGTYRKNPGQAAQNILINGHGKFTDPKTNISTNAPLQMFTVYSGKRYRFRMINSFSTVCLSEVTIEGHSMTIIAQDGANVAPVKVKNIITATGERVDFIINANKGKRSYWIHVRGLGECEEKGIYQLGVLHYYGAPEKPSTPAPTYNTPESGLVYNPLDATGCNGKPRADRICVNQMKAMKPNHPALLKVEPDARLVFNFDFYNYNNSLQQLFGSDSEPYKRFFVAPDRTHLTSLVNSITFENPPGPPIAQRAGYSKLCNINELSTCSDPCTCSQMYSLPKNAVIEVVVYDKEQLAGLAHPFHLHGYEFFLFAIGQLNKTKIMTDDVAQFITEHMGRLERGEYGEYVPGKDTVVVPQGGYVIVRFISDNPGFWLFHCHFSWHTATGMNVVLHVGTREDLPPVPYDFPQCYDYKPQGP